MKFSLLAAPLALLSASAWANDAADGSSGSRASDATVATNATTVSDTTEFELASGIDYSTGSYGAASDTSVVSVPLDFKLRSGRFRGQVSVPFVTVKGPGQIVGGVVVPSSNNAVVSRSGLGDVGVSAAYLLSQQAHGLPAFELGVAAKVPTAKQTIGTGKMDYSVNLSAYEALGPNATLFGSLGYSWLTSPAAYQLNNGIAASGGFNLRTAPATNLGFSVAYREPVATGLQGQATVSPYVTHRLGGNVGLTLYGVAGLNQASPRVGAGLRLSIIR